MDYWEPVNEPLGGGVSTGGHILSLHEGVFHDDAVDKWFGDGIPGAPQVDGAGALCCRYRFLAHLLKQRGELVPFVIRVLRRGRVQRRRQSGRRPEPVQVVRRTGQG